MVQARQAWLFRRPSSFRSLAEVFEDFLFACPALLIQTEQLVGPLVWFDRASQLDQKARYQRAIDLSLDASHILTKQVAA